MEGRSSGAPPEACADIVPNHEGSPSTNPIRYFVSLRDFKDNEYVAGQNYTSKCVHYVSIVNCMIIIVQLEWVVLRIILKAS